jgi:subtilase family serine protease
VAAQSGDVISNGYAVYAAGALSQGGGTSLSSPLWMGMWARIQSAARPGGNGFADWSLYRLGNDRVAAPQGFYDVVVGDNGYPAIAGWDYVTGFGTPRVDGLIHLIDGR